VRADLGKNQREDISAQGKTRNSKELTSLISSFERRF